jgi:NADPH:quinone reductase-like Zn-dependent oxidoreductase
MDRRTTSQHEESGMKAVLIKVHTASLNAADYTTRRQGVAI